MPDIVPLFDSSALRKVELRAAAAFGGDDFELMRRAGQAAWRHVLQQWPQAQRIVIVCGPGNNGGDGYVLALHALEAGRDVAVYRLPAHAPRTGPARRACDAYVGGGGQVLATIDGLTTADLIVDGLFGIGLSRAPDTDAAGLIGAINSASCPVLALDVPSGVDADRGHCPGITVIATRTLEFLAPHPGLRTGVALDYVGQLQLASLDPPAAAWADTDCADGAPMAEWLCAGRLAWWLPQRKRDSHKGRNGHVLCVGGDTGMGGAVLLCAEAALRCGAGLTSVATRARHLIALLARLPECMAVNAGTQELKAAVARADVIAIGPGLGRGDWGRRLFEIVLECDKPQVLDADALNLLVERLAAQGVASERKRLPPEVVITPHPGEAARLLGIDVAAVQADRFAAAIQLANTFDCTVVLKGAGTIVAAPGRIPQVIGAGNPGMAVAGMGDVLTGVIAGLRAQGLEMFDAARCGALLHAHAGDLAARNGQRGMLPSDLLACLRSAANPSSAPRTTHL